jgi:methylase of polypeptide subunit release factors
MKKIVFKNDQNQPLELFTLPNVFEPNTTTRLLINAVLSVVNSEKKILDLGCGTGAVAISLLKEGISGNKIYASDLSVEATKCCLENAKSYNCASDIRTGSMFDPWLDEKFDVVVDDISAISEDIANISPWFPGVPCSAGRDGTNLVSRIITDAKKHLKTDEGLFFFPVLSLSNVDQILIEAKQNFKYVEIIKRESWPLPEDLMPHMGLLETLSNENAIKLNKKFGMVVCYTEVYCASNKKFI